MGSSSPSYPQPTAQETALQNYQLELLKKQGATSEAYEPLLLAQLGYKKVPRAATATQGATSAAPTGITIGPLTSYDPAKLVSAPTGPVIGMGGERTSGYTYDYGGGNIVPVIKQGNQIIPVDSRGNPIPAQVMTAKGSQVVSDTGLTGIGQPSYDLVPMSAEERNALLTPDELASQELERKTKEAELANLGLTSEYQQLQLKSLRGEMPISPALESELQNQENILKSTLSQRLGSNWMLSTPGIQTMTQFKQKADIVREEARRGMITSLSSLTAPQTTSANTNLQQIGGTYGLLSQGTTSILDRIPGLLEPYSTQRGGTYTAGLNEAQRQAQLNSAILGTVGMIGGTVLAGPVGGAIGGGLLSYAGRRY